MEIPRENIAKTGEMLNFCNANPNESRLRPPRRPTLLEMTCHVGSGEMLNFCNANPNESRLRPPRRPTLCEMTCHVGSAFARYLHGMPSLT